jgi:hypothetical protein
MSNPVVPDLLQKFGVPLFVRISAVAWSALVRAQHCYRYIDWRLLQLLLRGGEGKLVYPRGLVSPSICTVLRTALAHALSSRCTAKVSFAVLCRHWYLPALRKVHIRGMRLTPGPVPALQSTKPDPSGGRFAVLSAANDFLPAVQPRPYDQVLYQPFRARSQTPPGGGSQFSQLRTTFYQPCSRNPTVQHRHAA